MEPKISNQWAKTPACDLGVDGFCYTHQTFNMAECANAEMNGTTSPTRRPGKVGNAKD